MSILELQPVFLNNVVSVSFRGVPSGLLGSVAMVPSKPTVFATNLASSKIGMSSLVPTFTQSGGLSKCIKWTTALAKSSTCRNSRLGVPVPQIVTVSNPFSLASWNRLIKAGNTWLFSGW